MHTSSANEVHNRNRNSTSALTPTTKHLEVCKKFVQSSDDSDDEDIEEIDREKVATLFRNYQGNETDLSRIKQFFENDENVDCLICKYLQVVKIKPKQGHPIPSF